MVLGLIFLIIIFSFVLIKSADIAVIALRRITRGASVFGISAVLIALGTSFPELFVGVTSALEKSPNLSLGVILGSNIANIALIGGMAALIAGKVEVHGEFLHRDVWIAFIASLIPLVLALDGDLNKVDGIILVLIYLAYAISFFKHRFLEIGNQNIDGKFFLRFLRKVNHMESKKSKEFGRLFVGIVLLLFSADIIVRLSSLLAGYLNISVFVIGLFILAIGTSLPEFAFSLRSLEDNQPSMFFGNLLGSIIANSTLIVGIVSIINPIKIVSVDHYLIAVVAFIVTYLTFYFFIRTKHRLDRWEALSLLVLYILFVVVEFV
jgi:cation:H+ antiporter